MKYLLFVLIFMISGCVAHCQTFSEWFHQKSTQIKYLNLQIAALMAYRQVAQKGYDIIKNGTSTIGDIKQGDLTMHADYFNSLNLVKPSVKDYSKVGAIINLQLSIVNIYRATYKSARQSNELTPEEVGIIYKVFTGIIEDCLVDLDLLADLTSDGKAQMKDDERIVRIDNLYKSMLNKYAFAAGLQNELSMVQTNRSAQKNESEFLRSIYGLK